MAQKFGPNVWIDVRFEPDKVTQYEHSMRIQDSANQVNLYLFVNSFSYLFVEKVNVQI